MPSKQLILMATGTTVVGGGIATGTYFLLPDDNSISKQLLKENKKILDVKASADLWKIKLHSYTEKRKTKHNLNLAKEEVANLQPWCTKTLNSKYKEGEDYESAKALCTVPTNEESLLQKKKTLTKEGEWEAKKTSYNDNSNDKLIDGIAKGSATDRSIRDWCNIALAKEYTTDTESNYSLTLKWCTKEGN